MEEFEFEFVASPESEVAIPARFQALLKFRKVLTDASARVYKDFDRRQRSWKKHRKTRYHQSQTGRRLRASQKKQMKLLAKQAS